MAVDGVGIGFRLQFAKRLLEELPPEVRWVEVAPENYMNRGGRYPHFLKRIHDKLPVVTHGLTQGYGNTTPVPADHIRDLKLFLKDMGTPFHSDHLCCSRIDDVYVHELIPVPFHEESKDNVVQRLREARERLDKPVLMENISFYAKSSQSDRQEIQFIREVLTESDAGMLLDVNNVFVNSQNFGFDPFAWIDAVPHQRVQQIHIAGHHVEKDGFRVDTHGEAIVPQVYDLLEHALKRTGPVPVLIERDGNFPPFEDLMTEVRQVSAIYRRATTTPQQTPRQPGAEACPA